MSETFALRVLALGAGVQSTTMLLMADRGDFGDKPDVAIFSDTGWEPKRVYDHLDWLEREINGRIPILRVSNGNLRQDALSGKRIATPPVFLIGKNGEHGILNRQCTHEYKIKPINWKIRELFGVGRRDRLTKKAQVWFGISMDEVQRMKVSPVSYVVNRYPLIEKGMDRTSCLLWMERNGYPTPPKSACIGCPYKSNRSWRMMKDQYPDEWADAVEFDAAIRHGLPGVRGTAFLHVSRMPLPEVDLRTLREKGQLTLFDEDEFGNECDGACGL